MAGEESPGSGPADASDTSVQPQAKRRRTAQAQSNATNATSSRGVANLTPEQLARKRANDREAQRAIRERTKTQIDSLNRRIRELESQRPYHDLQLVVREKDAVLAENADIRKRLESVLSILGPIVRGASGLNELAAAAAREPSAPGPPPTIAPPDPRIFHSTLGEIAASPQNGVLTPSGTEPGRPWPYPSEASNHVRRWADESPHYAAEQRPQMPPELPLDERMGVDFLCENSGQRPYMDPSSPNAAPRPTITTNGVGQHAPTLVPHLTLPRNIGSTCPLDAVLLDFLGERQTRAASGDPMTSVVGPMYPNLTAFKSQDRKIDSHPLSQLLTDILRTFPDICGLPEQIAIVYIMFLIMRWQIEPTRENYERLPHWVTPRASQLFVPHPPWMDHVPWPRLRDRLIGNGQNFLNFDAFFIPFTTTISINWPYNPNDCLLPASKVNLPASSTGSLAASSPYSTAVNAGSPAPPLTPQPIVGTPGTVNSASGADEQYLINPAFESHLRNLNNWSLGPDFRAQFPNLSGAVRIKEGR